MNGQKHKHLMGEEHDVIHFQSTTTVYFNSKSIECIHDKFSTNMESGNLFLSIC
jgi:hypothetical protein